MYIYWNYPHDHMLALNSNDNWMLSVEMDEYESACMYLQIGSQKLILYSSDFYLQGLEHTRLDSYHIIDFFNAVLRHSYEEIITGTPVIDLIAIQKNILPEYWTLWESQGLFSNIPNNYFD